MASPHNLFWVALLLAMMTSYVVHTAPTGIQEQPAAELDSEDFQEAVEEAGKLGGSDGATEKSLEEDKEIEEVEGLSSNGGQPETLEEDEDEEDAVDEGIGDITDVDITDDVIKDIKDDVIKDDVINDDAIDDDITGSSSEPDATDYIWEPSFNYDSVGDSDLNPWFLYDLPYDPPQWSSFDIFDEEYPPYYESTYDSINDFDTNNLNNNLNVDIPEGVFDGIPGEELNNKVDQTVDELLCMLGLCDDVRVDPEEDVWEEPNEIQFTEEGMMGNSGKEEESDEKATYTVDVQHEDPNDETTNSSSEVKDEEEESSRPKRDAPSSPESGKHRSKRDLSWDELESDNDLLDKINSLDGLQDDEIDQGDLGLTAADRFEDLLEYFKDEAAEKGNKEEFYIGVPEPVLDELVGDTTADGFQDAVEDEEEEGGEENGLEETGEFVEDGEDGDDWGPYLVPGSPYTEDTLRYDGYKRDDEREALKVYIESLQNMEGYRKRGDQGENMDDDSRSATNFLRQLVPRSPPNAIRYPKTGLEPFSRQKYFPLFPEPNGLADDDAIADPDPEEVLAKYNELMDLLNSDIEAAALMSTIEDMAAELGRDQRLLDELEEEQAEAELELALFNNDRQMLELVGNSRPMKRSPRVMDYPDFNEFPPEFYKSVPVPTNDDLSEEELIRLNNEYLQDAADEAEWGNFVYQPRERREGEENLPGPHGGYYVQGRMMGNLMKPKRNWEAHNEVDDELLEGDIPAGETDRPYVLIEPSDLGYNEWPGEFEVFYDTRDGTFVMYPYSEPQDAKVTSAETLLDALALSGRNFVVDDDEEEEEEEGEGKEDVKWGYLQADDNVLRNDLKEINKELSQLDNLLQLAEMTDIEMEEDEVTEEAFLLGALFGK